MSDERDDDNDGDRKIDRNTPVPPAPQGDDEYNEQFAERFMLGSLIKAATRQLRDLQVAFPLLTEAEQTKVLKRVEDDLRPAIKNAIQIIKDHGRIQFPAECKQVVFKGATDVQATFNLVAHSGAHALADYSGRTVTVVIDETDEMLNPGDSTKGAPDQADLLEGDKD